MVNHFDGLNRIEPPSNSYASRDDLAAGVTDTKVFPSIIYVTFKPTRSIESKVKLGTATAMSFPRAIVDELRAALGSLDVMVEESPAHFSVDMESGHKFVPHVIMLCFPTIPTIGHDAQINVYADGIVSARRQYLANPLYRRVLDVSIEKLFK